MEKFKTQKIENLQEIVGGKNSIVIVDDVVFIAKTIIADDLVMCNGIVIIDEVIF